MKCNGGPDLSTRGEAVIGKLLWENGTGDQKDNWRVSKTGLVGEQQPGRGTT